MYVERPAGIAGAVVWTHAPQEEGGRVLPDGCMDLIWAHGHHLLVAGPDTRAQPPDPAGAARYTGVRFAPGAGPDVFGVRACELTERVAGAREPGAALEAVAAGRLRRAGDPEPWRAAAVAALARGRSVAWTAREVGLSERQLRRRSLAAFGYGPKTLARVLRMRRALAMARSGVPPAEVAARCGYADQAHLAREVRELAGAPLSALCRPPTPSGQGVPGR